MQDQPRRLRRFAAARPFGLRPGETARDGMFQPGERRRLLRRVRAVRRASLVLLWTLLAAPLQALFITLSGRQKVVFARVYWAMVCRLIGFNVRVIGAPAGQGSGTTRSVVYVSNHSSWLDIAILGGRLEGCFISKDDVSRWPVVRTIARLGRTVFVTRQRSATSKERDAMRARLAQGDNLILFPEGTSSDGSRVLPFRSSFFSVAEGENPPLIQPVSVVCDRLAYLPTGRASRPVFAWYGDMNLASHFWRLAQYRGLRATILLHAPLDPARFANRKELSAAVWKAVADGAATLRQNRPARPLVPEERTEAGQEGNQPAFV